MEQEWLQDQIIQCCDCEDKFVLSAKEQLYFTTKIITNEDGTTSALALPKRCPACRRRRKGGA